MIGRAPTEGGHITHKQPLTFTAVSQLDTSHRETPKSSPTGRSGWRWLATMAVVQPPIAFLHLPRTGGTSLGQAIRRDFGHRAHWVHVLKQLSPEQVAAISPDVEIIYGHMNYGLHRHIPVRYATVLREPVDRCLSHYRLHETQLASRNETCTLEEFLWLRYADNVQCRMISGVYTDQPRPPAEYALAKAKEALAGFAIVGFFDDLPRFARAIRVAEPLPKLNALRSDFTPSPEDHEALRRLNWADAELFNWARARFS